jgi:hypothetical protein
MLLVVWFLCLSICAKVRKPVPVLFPPWIFPICIEKIAARSWHCLPQRSLRGQMPYMQNHGQLSPCADERICVRRLVMKYALKKAHLGDKTSLILLKALGGKKPSTFEFQNLLPALPVPPLHKTLERCDHFHVFQRR